MSLSIDPKPITLTPPRPGKRAEATLGLEPFQLPARQPRYESLWAQRNNFQLDRQTATESLNLACDWIIRCAMHDDHALPDEQNPYGYTYDSWRGVVREYEAATEQWRVFGPLWHTGQAVKALVMAHQVTGREDVLDAARLGADFILNARIENKNDPDYGAIIAFENADPDYSATSCMLEAIDGLITLGEHLGEERYGHAVIDCLTWAQRRLFLRDEGLFLDDFNVRTRQVRARPNTELHGVPGRPLLDDGVFLSAYQKTGRREFETVFFTTAERLLAEEEPAGNWINFPPCDSVGGLIHPRHAYWWGRPMIRAWQASGDRRFLHCAIRCADWYVQAQRADGGMFRATTPNFSSTCFGQCTSGILCAASLWHDLIVLGEGDAYRQPLRHAIRFAHSVQFVSASDPNLRGAILESMDAPDGSDKPPYNVRDLASIFYIQALTAALRSDLLD